MSDTKKKSATEPNSHKKVNLRKNPRLWTRGIILGYRYINQLFQISFQYIHHTHSINFLADVEDITNILKSLSLKLTDVKLEKILLFILEKELLLSIKLKLKQLLSEEKKGNK